MEQTIAMARSVHRYRYRMGVGYSVQDDGSVIENYWEKLPDDDSTKQRKPYRIELVGVVCDAYLAVVRGIRSSSSSVLLPLRLLADIKNGFLPQAGSYHEARCESEVSAQVTPAIRSRFSQVL